MQAPSRKHIGGLDQSEEEPEEPAVEVDSTLVELLVESEDGDESDDDPAVLDEVPLELDRASFL